MFPVLPSSVTQNLDDVPSNQEIYEALKDMAPLKAPVDERRWSPFRFIRNGTPLSHLFFADDLILYARADLDQADVLESILSEFGRFSGHKKYRVIDTCPTTIARSSCTPLWRALSNGWDEFLSNIASSVGNGNSIRLYSDIWVPTLGPLYQHTLANPNSLEALSISDFVSRDGTWSMPMLHRHFNADAIAHIIGIRCSDPLDVVDRAMWCWTTQHTFALKSAYMHLASSHWPPRQTIWKLIWRMAIPQRLHLFLWLAYQQNIMTNATRYCRNLAPSRTCPLCGNLPESVLHTLRDCADVRHLWSQILPDAVQRPFFGSNLHNWLSCNLSTAFIHPSVGLPWPLIFSAFVRNAAPLIASQLFWKASEQGWSSRYDGKTSRYF
ncbi:hypothetical protein V6N12_037252 [Hibiscus sabdariffa]|uniref:Reverse transcriptase zinc-binding domain-containing protein n=1 Tax=Hibiscus sabdariffa TaxID=183260 RepID=A0ABR2C3B2_9ROSI